MAKFYGPVGYAPEESIETKPGVYEDIPTEIKYRGDVLRNTRRLDTGDKVNSDISVSNSISIVSDAYMNANFHRIRYVQWMGTRWIVSEVEVEHPRLILRLGGVYNGPTPGTP